MRPVTARTRQPQGLSPGFRRRRVLARPQSPSGPWGLSDVDGYRALLRYSRREGHARVPRGHREQGVELGAWVHNKRAGYKRGRLSLEQISVLERVLGWTWQVVPTPRKRPFPLMFKLLRRYAKREGHARVPEAHVEGGWPLGQWVRDRRRAHKRGRLERLDSRALERLPGWAWRLRPLRRTEPFERVLRALRQYAKREGHARVPQHHVEGKLRLGRWVSWRRQSYRRGRLPQTHIQALERIPGWVWRAAPTPRKKPFDVMLRALRRFAAREKHARVPQGHVEGSLRLGRWVAKRRRAYQSVRLPQSQIRALERLPGWVWRAGPTPRRRPFEVVLGVLRRFAAREGHARVPRGHVEQGVPLGQWVSTQRWNHKRGSLHPSKSQALESVPGWAWQVRPTPRTRR
ncbi:MAG: helicase associated domain-containing protein [Acidobacteria bacterium]|nr:helicase associated domain-containing protein [Acidobacteriota bacterium]